MLFIIAVDALQQLIGETNSVLTLTISPKIEQLIVRYQYTDDTAIIAHGDNTTLISLKLMLRLFTKVSGLKINYEKISYLPINLSLRQIISVESILGCVRIELPLTYLGMPHTIKKPSRQDFLPLLQKQEQILDGWQTKIISRGGWLQFINLVITTIPIYHMACFAFPRWLINMIELLCRMFLWGSHDNQRVAVPYKLGNSHSPKGFERNMSP